MKYFANSVCDYIKAQIECHKVKGSAEKALLMLPSFPAGVLVNIGRELEARVSPLVADLTYKIAKPLWEEWRESSSSPDIQAYLQEAERKGWLDVQGNLTSYRNAVSANPGATTAVILGGIDHVTDAASLSDFHCCQTTTIWEWSEGLNKAFGSWIKECLENASVAYEEEVIAHFDNVLKTLLERVPTDIIRISELLDGLNLADAQDGRDAERVLLKSLDSFGLPQFTGYRFGGRRSFPPYVDAALSFASYGMFLEQRPREKALKNVKKYLEDKGSKNALYDEGKTGSYASDDAFLEDLIAYIGHGSHEELGRLLECDFVTIQDEVLKYRPPREPREPKPPKVKKLGIDPLECVLTALWLTLAEFKKDSEKRGDIAHDVIREIRIESFLFKHDCDGASPDERQEAARLYLKEFLGGLDGWLTKYIALETENAQTDANRVSAYSNLIKQDIDFQYSAIAEPQLSFAVTIIPEEESNQTTCSFALRLPDNSPFRMADELFRWGHSELVKATDYFLPVFFVPYYDELMLAKDDEEATRVLMHGIRSEGKLMVDVLAPALAELTPEESVFAESLKKLAGTYGALIKRAAQNGLYGALSDKWDDLRHACQDTYDAFLAPNSPVHKDHGAILQRAFLFVQKRSETDGNQWMWKRYEPSAAVTVLHPALLELLHARIIYLFECFNAEVNKQLRATGARCFKKALWDYYLGLAAVKMPLCGLLRDKDLVFETSIRGDNLLHRIGEVTTSDATLSTRLLLRYDAFEDEDISDEAMFRETRESLMLFRIMKEYWELHPHAKDGISLAIYQNQDIQPLIAATNQFISDSERRDVGTDSPYHIAITIFSESGDDTGIFRWIEQWKERWEAAEIHDKLAHYRECRLSVSHRIITPDRSYEQFRNIIKSSLEVDIAILSNFINAGEQGNQFEEVPAPYDVTTRPIKFPILEKTFCSPQEGRYAHERYRILSNRQFMLATKHTEVMARLKGMELSDHVALGCGDFTPWRGVIDDLHKNTEWVVCIDPSIDERLLEVTGDQTVRDIIGFGSGVGSHGEANYTISTEQFHFSDLQHKLKVSISGIVVGWSEEDHTQAAQFAINQAKGLSGLSLIRATGLGQHIRDVMAYTLARKYFRAEGDLLCDQFVSLDAYRHWFDGADSNMRPDILWLTAKITDSGALHLDMRIIECKLAKRSDSHLQKAREQVESGLQHLIPAFMPRQSPDEKERPDARYWWLQLHRLVASKSQASSTQRAATLNALEHMADGDYSISWGAAVFACWTDDSADTIQKLTSWTFSFRDKALDIVPIVTGSQAIRDLCRDECDGSFVWDNQCMTYSCQLGIPSQGTAIVDEIPTSPSLETEEPISQVAVTPEEEYEQEDASGIIPDSEVVPVTHSAIPDRICLGVSSRGSRPVFWEFGHKELHNRHMLIFGSSGMGKTYAIQCLLNELGHSGQNSLVIDYTNGFLPNQLEDITAQSLCPKQHIIRKSPLPISPFKLQQQIIGDDIIPESHSTAAKRIAAIFKVVYDLGDQQFSVLFDAIILGMQSYGDAFKLDNLLDVLEGYIEEKTHNKSTVQSTMSKLKPFIMDKPFSSDVGGIGWESIFRDHDHLCHIFQLAGLDMHSRRLVTEFILWDLYAYVRGSGNKNDPKMVVLDEVQNLDHREECPLAKYLTEGRKFGLSLILATQTLSNLSSGQQSRLFQAGHKLFFRPAETEMGEYGKVLQNATGEPSRTWIERLSKLQKGECYSLGPTLGENDTLKQVAFKIRITPLEERSLDG